jgi:outer membrane protein OmpA-like peptidoglycan-associated protein
MSTGRPLGGRATRGLLLVAFLAVVLGGSWATARWISDQADPGAAPVVATGVSSPTTTTGGSTAAEPTEALTPESTSSASPSVSPSGAEVPQARVLFASDSAAISPAAKIDLERVVTYVRSSRTAFVIVHGHSDGRGSSTSKHDIASLRAHAVEDYLAACGIPWEQLSHTNFSDTRPAASGTATPNDALDRRVDVIVRDVP